MIFKPYCIALTSRGLRVLPAGAFNESRWPFAAYIETRDDELIFKQLLPNWAWVIRYRYRR